MSMQPKPDMVTMQVRSDACDQFPVHAFLQYGVVVLSFLYIHFPTVRVAVVITAEHVYFFVTVS